MAGALTPEQQWELIQTYGSIENARDEAMRRSPELGELWNAWWPQTPDFWKVFWKRALPVLGIDAAPPVTAMAQPEPSQHEGTLRGDPGRKPQTMPAKTFWKIFELGMAHAESDNETPSLRSIAETTKRREFVTEHRDQPMGVHGPHKWWYRCLHRAGIVAEGVTHGRKMHMARHTAGQSVLDRTGNLKAVQKLLGHSSITTTGDIYTDWDIDQLEETMRYVGRRGRR